MIPLLRLMAQLTLAAVVVAGVGKAARPNIVFMLADDWGWGDIGANHPGGRFAQTGTNTLTPNIDMLAGNGTLFTDFHTGQSFCAPSRTSFMTGKFPADVKVNSNWNTGPNGAAPNHAAGLPYQLPLPSGSGASPYPGGLPNVAHILQQAGYATAHFGKWHLGGVSPNVNATPVPHEYGFDRTGTYGSPIQALPWLATEIDALAGNITDRWWSADVGDYIRDAGIAFMTNATRHGVPFYVHFWWHMSHDTIDPRPEQLLDFPFQSTCLFPAKQLGQVTCPAQVFWGAQTYSDKHRFSRVIDAVDQLGIRNNTYIVFSADNGAQTQKWHGKAGLGEFDNAVGTQGPFRGCKASSYEGGHRVPFIVSGPGVPKGRVDHSLLSATDWLPTIAALAGAPVPSGTLLRGQDVSDIWHGKANHVVQRQRPLFWRNAGSPGKCWDAAPALAHRNGNWKLLLNPDYDAPASQKPRFPRVELYNMSVAQFGTEALSGAFLEARNMAADFPETVAAMAAPLLAWHREVGPIHPGSTDHALSSASRGCEAYPFPGIQPAV